MNLLTKLQRQQYPHPLSRDVLSIYLPPNNSSRSLTWKTGPLPNSSCGKRSLSLSTPYDETFLKPWNLRKEFVKTSMGRTSPFGTFCGRRKDIRHDAEQTVHPQQTTEMLLLVFKRRPYSVELKQPFRSYSSSNSPPPPPPPPRSSFFSRILSSISLFFRGRRRNSLRLEQVLGIFSWFALGNVGFILVGTTSFISCLLWIINHTDLEDYFARLVANYLTRSTGYQISFEQGRITPQWKSGTLRLENVSVICNGDTWKQLLRELNASKPSFAKEPYSEDDVDVNWTYWDLTIKSMDVTLSLWRWLDGKGIIEECILNGIRGTADNRHVYWPENWTPTRRTPLFSDFDMTRFVVDDCLITVSTPNFRPFPLSVFHAETSRFRLQWMLYDVICADSIIGTVDNCLFSVHRPHTFQDLIQMQQISESDVCEGFEDSAAAALPSARFKAAKKESGPQWAKMTHLKMSRLPIGHLNTGVQGPISWITSGTMDIDVDVFIPPAPKESGAVIEILQEEISHLREKALQSLDKIAENHPNWQEMNAAYQEQQRLKEVSPAAASSSIPNLRRAKSAKIPSTLYPSAQSRSIPPPEANNKSIIMYWDIVFNDIKATLPLYTPELSYMSNTLIRPVFAYLNAHKTTLPLSFTVNMDPGKFDGAWTIYSSGLADELGVEVGKALVESVQDEAEKARRLRRIGLWSLQNVTKNVMGFFEFVWANYTHPSAGWWDHAMVVHSQQQQVSTRSDESSGTGSVNWRLDGNPW